MAKFNVGDTVFVPSRLLPKPDEQPFALMRRTVTGNANRSVRIDVQDDTVSDIEVSSKLVHSAELGITVLRVGHFVTEETALDPLAKSLLQFSRLLVDDQVVRLVEVRTAAEIQAIWAKVGPLTSHVILIGHGRSDSFRLLDEPKPLPGSQFAALFENVPKSKPKTWVSLSCLTGRTPFAKPFSSSEVCADFFAPYQSVHVAAASQFAQTFFVNHLLNAVGVIAAHRRAIDAVGSGVSFRHWRNGVRRSQP